MHVGAVLPRALLRAPLRSARAHARTRTHARTHARARTRAAQRARTHARRSARAHARRSARTRATLPQCGCAGPCLPARACGERSATARASDGRERNPNSHVPPLPPTPIPPPSSGRVGCRKEMQFPAGSSIDASCDRSLWPMVWPAHVGPRLPARPAAAAGPAGPRQLPARPVRGGCRHGCPLRLPARPVSGGCWHDRPASAAGTAGPRWLPARPARLGCRHGRPAAVTGTACPRRLHENGSENS